MPTINELYDEIKKLGEKMVNPYFTADEACDFMKLTDKKRKRSLRWLVAEGFLSAIPRTGDPVYSRAECEALLPRLDTGLLPTASELVEYFKHKKDKAA